jgi:tetratricopeptide (TPR) repeat protein
VLGLLLLSILPYLNGLPNDFTYDDKLIIRDNERIASPSVVGRIFTTQYFGGSLASGQNYRPVVLLTYAVQRWIHGNRPSLFRAVNIGLHAAASVALFAWLLALGFPRGPSLAVGALFSVTTIHVEAVTGLVGRAEVLAALLVLLAAVSWLAATEAPELDIRRYAACLALFQAAVFVKENAVVVPGVIALGELFRGGRARSVRELVAEMAPARRLAFLGLFVPVGVLFVVRRLVLKGFLISREAGIFDLENPLVALSPALRIANAATLVFRYAAKTLVPAGLSADHSAYALPLAARLFEPRAFLGLAGILLGIALAVVLWSKRPLASFGLAFFFGTLLPTANLLFPIGTIYAERLMYLPAAGLFAFVVGLLTPAPRTVPRPSALPWREGLITAAVVVYAVATVLRNRAWKDDVTLYADMVKKVPNSAKAHYDVAYDAQRRNDVPLAKEHLERAVAIFPHYYDAWASLGKMAWDDEKWDEAIALYRKSVEVFPKYENGRWSLAKVLDEAGRTAEAGEAFDEGAREIPDSYPIAYHRATFLGAQGRFDEAEAEWRRALKLGEGAGLAHAGLAETLAARGREGDEAEAWNEARLALVADPNCVEARLFLAGRYEKQGKILAAAGELSRAVRTDPENEDAGAALLELAFRRPEVRNRALLALPAIRTAVPEPEERLTAALAAFR